MQPGPRRGTRGQPDSYYTQPRPTYKNGPPGYGSGPGYNPTGPAYGPDPGFGPPAPPGPTPMMMQPDGPVPNGGGWNWLPLILGWGMFIAGLAATGISMAAIWDLDEAENTTAYFYHDSYIAIGAIVFMVGGLLNIVNGKFGSELTRGLAMAGSGMAFVAAVLLMTITAKVLDEADGDLPDKDENYLTAVTVALGAEVLFSLIALIVGLVSFHMRRQEPLPPY